MSATSDQPLAPSTGGVTGTKQAPKSPFLDIDGSLREVREALIEGERGDEATSDERPEPVREAASDVKEAVSQLARALMQTVSSRGRTASQDDPPPSDSESRDS